MVTTDPRRLLLDRRHMPPVIQRADERAYAWLAGRPTPVFDKVLPRLSRAANHSRLWLAIAAGLAAVPGVRGRKAAVRGLMAIGVASSISNGPLKLLLRRHRPELAGIPLPRRLARLPWTSSFPSGHSASAAAFATAAGLELPAAAGPLGVLAAGVAVSRVYTGVHYPSDVAVGAAIGVGAGLLTHQMADARARRVTPTAPPREVGRIDVGDGRGLVIAVNPNAGGPVQKDPHDALQKAFPAATIVSSGTSLSDDVRALCGPDTSAIVAAGGDGTVNEMAAIALDHGLPLGVVPAGTLNHLSRDLGIEDTGAAVKAITEGRLAQMDIGIIAEQPFLNTASFGAYSALVDKREQLEDKIGKWPAASYALFDMLRHNRPVEVEIDGRSMSVWAIFIGNCAYEPSGFIPMRRTSLDDGLFDVRVLLSDRAHPKFRPVLAQGFGRMTHLSTFESWSADRVEVRSLEGPLRLARDGETFDGPDAFTIEKSPKQIHVFVPEPKR